MPNNPPKIMPHQLAVEAGIDRDTALKILQILEKKGFCRLKTLVYHRCTPDVPVSAIAYSTTPELPWVCPFCEEPVEALEELSFDAIALAEGAEFAGD